MKDIDRQYDTMGGIKRVYGKFCFAICHKCEYMIKKEEDVRYLADKPTCISCCDYTLEEGISNAISDSYHMPDRYYGSDEYEFDKYKAIEKIKNFILKEIMGIE